MMPDYKHVVIDAPYTSFTAGIAVGELAGLKDEGWKMSGDAYDEPGKGRIIGTTFDATLEGPDFPSPSDRAHAGEYHCIVTAVTDRWGEEGDWPVVEPGEPRPPDWHPGQMRGHRAANAARGAYRMWLEGTRARAGLGTGLVRGVRVP
jgi:hypothetical protein